MKLALAYSTKDQVELTKQTFPRIGPVFTWWVDGSFDPEAVAYAKSHEGYIDINIDYGIKGGADATIAYKLSKLLNEFPLEYTHIGLLENDVLLDHDWLEPTLELFEKGKADGLEVGAVSPRSYVDRILIQQGGYAVMHNIGAGAIIFTREAAEIVLRTLRTGWWPDNVRLFAQLSGIDLRTYAAFRGNEQPVTTDWTWEAQLARRGLASLALTPSKAQMIGQVPSLAEQGLELTKHDNHGNPLGDARCQMTFENFERYRDNLAALRSGHYYDGIQTIRCEGAGMLFMPHQLGYLAGGPTWQGKLFLKNSQGHGPFVYRAGKVGASLSLRISGSCSYLVTGGQDGARVTIEDTRSGFKSGPDLPAGDQLIAIQVPGGPVPRTIKMDMAEGAVFYGIQTAEPQMLDTTFRFEWQQLPEAE